VWSGWAVRRCQLTPVSGLIDVRLVLRWTGEFGGSTVSAPRRAASSARAAARPEAETPSRSRSNTISLTGSSSSLTIAKSVLIDGSVLPVSICEIRLAETPSRRASSRTPMFFC